MQIRLNLFHRFGLAACAPIFLAVLAASARAADSPAAVVKSENVTVKVMLGSGAAAAGGRLPVVVNFSVAPGWHIYGAPLPPDFTVTRVNFDKEIVGQQSLTFPPPTPLKFAALNQTYPVYQGNFAASGAVTLKPTISAGPHELKGNVEFQECNDLECKMPQSLPFAIPLNVRQAR
ncbi:MAG TPA: protein-disulfide reductase DsbD domain-containing protein [Candidatus Binataceae bacterium]|jgi:DsbC/DsbD-like thiol-disulfide interchange protein|nr:protein-disulfide reductase DsbD domain-containing protein [Candidatus Binataceae bacterium]